MFRHWKLSGYNESLLRSKRHQLNECPKGIPAEWIDRLTDTLTLITFKQFFFGDWWPISVYFAEQCPHFWQRWPRRRKCFTSRGTTSGGTTTRKGWNAACAHVSAGVRRCGGGPLTWLACVCGRWMRQGRIHACPIFNEVFLVYAYAFCLCAGSWLKFWLCWTPIFFINKFQISASEVTEEMIDNMISAFLNGILERIQIVVLCFVLYFFLFLYSSLLFLCIHSSILLGLCP